MGYSAYISEQSFLIKQSNIETAFDEAKYDLRNSKEKIIYIDREDLENSSNLCDLFEVFGFEIEKDPITLDINKLEFVWDKLGNDENLFGLIAPYIEEGSYIQWVGEDGDIWRYVFRNNTFEIIKPNIEW